MDQRSPDSTPSVELPSPEFELPNPEVHQQDTYNERQNARKIENVPSPPSIPPTAMPTTTPISPPVPVIQPQTAPGAGITGLPATPHIADDSDLIEKEWVERAKRIVEHTKHDPHLQTKEMSVMKADYLKKRYNKDLKQSD